MWNAFMSVTHWILPGSAPKSFQEVATDEKFGQAKGGRGRVAA